MLRDPGQHALNMDSVVLAQFRVNPKRFMQHLYLNANMLLQDHSNCLPSHSHGLFDSELILIFIYVCFLLLFKEKIII